LCNIPQALIGKVENIQDRHVNAVTNQVTNLQYTLSQPAGSGLTVSIKGFVPCGFSAKLPSDQDRRSNPATHKQMA
jgi:hypothetical protein